MVMPAQRANQYFTERSKDDMNEAKDESMDESDDICVLLMKRWNLEQYKDTLIEEEGFDDIDDFNALTYDKLIEMGFKEGHSKRFI